MHRTAHNYNFNLNEEKCLELFVETKIKQKIWAPERNKENEKTNENKNKSITIVLSPRDICPPWHICPVR